MKNQLVGKIVWVDDDFNYNDVQREKEHTVSQIENVIIDDTMIKFYTDGKGCLDRSFYAINLLGDSTKYQNYRGEDIVIECEIFKSKNKELLYGTWNEDGVDYTWWAIIPVAQ